MYAFPPIAAAVELTHTAVAGLAVLLAPVAGAAAAAAAVVCLTALVRIALLPLSVAQVRAEQTRARLAPRLRELQREHADDPQRLLTAQRELYAAEGSSPLAGCLPTLAQLPVFAVLYGVFIGAGGGGDLLGATLGGAPLGSGLGDALASGEPARMLVFAVLLAVLAATAWASRRFLTLPAMARAAEDGDPDAPATRVMAAMSYLSYTTVVFAAFVPLAAGLYLAATTAWTVAERLVLRRLVGAGGPA
ncbi:YidC/Oxa1 family membrane protein insertase [Streptomonospora nanhaiensis]|uniref:Membrane protein insertase YidC n=1 Tax=Streptomonospora nanhaiensis TaxID=1323731 RepID=A0A853BQ54_9ACTN|nr:membrane protein insertase YidC [Streptomonospora nanhaiensis]MBV2365149.1 YidC/Oxa1 family membrane protein insertase [Streptomonospora nanhaiensis]NYI96641.1 YidC/Oxa1 family membrane protein insertase [Streptomonospora nanhaiensis]